MEIGLNEEIVTYPYCGYGTAFFVIPVNFKLMKAVSCRKIGLKCIVELMRRVTQVACIFTNNKQYYSLKFFNIFVPHLPIAPGTCKKVVKR